MSDRVMTLTKHEALSAADAYLYLQLKDKLPSGCLINLTGKITAVSEIIRVKKDLLFLIEVENNVKIVVKQKHYLVWQEKITPEEEYIFTNLRATTLIKGSVTPFKLFVPWSRSRLYLTCETEHTVISLQDWLNNEKVELPEILQTQTPTDVTEARSSTKLVSYQGVITNSDQQHLGIYELDHKIGLYVSCVPACHKFSSLSLGSKIVVYNAHRRGFTNVPKIRLFGCVSTCIKVVEGSEPVACKQLPPRSIMLQPISLYSLTSTEVASLMELPSVLAERLNIPSCSFSLSRITQLIPLLLNSSCCQWLQEKPRNLLQEFLEVPHDCCVTKLKTPTRIPSIACIGKERDELSEKSGDLTDLQQKYYGSRLPVTELNQQLYWSPVSDAVMGGPGKILIGYLQSNPVTGRFQLQDATGSVDIVVYSSPNGSHVCCPQCASPRLGSVLACPVLHPSLIGSIVCVRKYQRNVERFLSTDVPNSYHIESNYVKRSRHHLYLMFSLTECVLLHTAYLPLNNNGESENKETEDTNNEMTSNCPERFQCEDSASCAPPKKRKKEDDSSVSNVARVSQLVYVSHKEPLTTVGRNLSPHLRFCLLGYLINQRSSVSGRSIDIDVTQCKMKNHSNSCSISASKDTCKTEKENSQRPNSKRTIGCIGGGTSSYSKRTDRCSRELSALTTEPSQAVSPPEPVVLLFQDNVQWFPVIKTNAFYRLSVDGEADALQAKLYGQKLQKAVRSSHTRMCVQVPAHTVVTRVFSQGESVLEEVDTSMFDKAEHFDIDEILLISCSASQVSLSGLIISRSHIPQETPSAGRNRTAKPSLQIELANERLGVSVLDNSCVCLQVQSLTSQKEITVYMKLQTTSYPLGLLPGMGVHFHRLERKVSRIDKVYCQYTAISTVEVYQIDDAHIQGLPVSILTAGSSSSTQTNSQADQCTTPPHQYIVDIWRNLAAAQLFHTSVYICHIMKLSLKSVCCGCGSIVSSLGCSSPVCHGIKSYLSARVSILVDDGTSPAVVVFANCPNLIQKLLRLSDEQWRHLEIATQDQREVFMQQFVGEGETILESFLIRLCNSHHVKRQCRMSLHHRGTQDGSCNTWKAGFIDINKMAKDEFSYHSVKASSMFETRCVPYLQLECVDLEEVNYNWV